jgi:spore coat protein H
VHSSSDCQSLSHRLATLIENLLVAGLIAGLIGGGVGGCGDDGVAGPGDGNPDAGLADAASPDATPEPTALCQPAPFWLTEGETVAIDVLCADPEDDVTGDAVALAPLPAGATYDAEAARLTWTPALDQAAVYEITASIPEREESVVLTVGVADAWDHPDNVPIVDRSKYPMEYGLPVFFLSPPPEDAEEYASVAVTYRGQTRYVAGKKRGRTSLDYPKNSYTLEFPRNAPFSDPEIAGGFMDKHKLVLGSTFDDNSYVRQRLAFELWNRFAHVQVQSFMAVLYLEDEFFGLYTVMDHVDDELMEQSGLGKDGNMYKAINHDANFRPTRNDGAAKQALSEGYEKKSGDPEAGPGAFDDLVALVDFVIDSDDATFAAEIGTRIDLDSYMDWLILITFVAGDDNAGKNTYHYHVLDGPWHVVPWDFNATSGQDYLTERRSAEDVDHYESYNLLFERFLEVPALRAQFEARYAAMLESVLSVADAHALIDEVVAEIGPMAARDQARWRAAYEGYESWNWRTDFTSHEEEVEYVRSWVAERWGALAEIYAE